MSSLETLESILPISELSWADQGDGPFIADVAPLGIDEQAMRYVLQGRVFDWRPESGIETVASESFNHCAALVVKNRDDDGFAFAHAQPFDDEFYDQMESRGQPPEEALFIFGTQSTHQLDLEELLANRGARLTAIYVETGNTNFGVAFNPLSGLVSIIRRTPDHSIFQYQPFRIG